MQNAADWQIAIAKALSIGTVRWIAERTGIPKSTVALRIQRPQDTTLRELERMQDAGLIFVKMTRKNP